MAMTGRKGAGRGGERQGRNQVTPANGDWGRKQGDLCNSKHIIVSSSVLFEGTHTTDTPVVTVVFQKNFDKQGGPEISLLRRHKCTVRQKQHSWGVHYGSRGSVYDRWLADCV